MSSSKITLVGMQRFLEYDDQTILTGATFPAGISVNTLIPVIMMRGGEFEILYPEKDIFQLFVTAWAAKWYRTFEKWIAALAIEYEPLNNYDRTEEWTTTDEGNELETRNLADSKTRTLQTSNTGSSIDTGSGTSTDTVSAYNSNAFENDKKNESSSSGTTSTTGSGTEAETDSGTNTGTVNRDRINENIRTGHAYGNIGVTTSQQMLQAELDISEWNLYKHIADLFIAEFCIPVY